METRLLIQIHANAPNRIKRDQPNYRIYINEELITERTWRWNRLTFIEEQLLVNLNRRQSYTIRIETIKNDPSHIGELYMQDLNVNGIAKQNIAEKQTELSFTLA